jgi:thymidylate synthase ThyX
VSVYVAEDFTTGESDILRRYFTNLDQPVFALVNLPEAVKGALFARYSRSPKTLRRLFLDEFVGELDIEGDTSVDATIGLDRAEELYDRVFLEYGDDSVAQLGGVHLACEQASNLLTKVLERGRLMSYLEQSTRYIAYDSRIGGRYRYYRDPEVMRSPLGTRFVSDMDRMFDTYSELVPKMADFFRTQFPRSDKDSDFIYRTAIQAKSLDAVRGLLPAAALSNVGIYGSGQAYETLLLRMRANPLPEARTYADLMLGELRKVIPSFLKRVDLEDRGVVWSKYLEERQTGMSALVDEFLPETSSIDDQPGVTLVDFDPDAEIKLVASMMYAYSSLPEAEIEQHVRVMGVEDRIAVVKAYVGERRNRRHRPGRALERPLYRFDVLSDYGAFRDLQRHRMMTVDWQKLSPQHGYQLPESLELAGHAGTFSECLDRSAALHDSLVSEFPAQASYAVGLAYNIRYSMHMNARAAMHMLELRTTPQGHPAYRKVCQEMHRQIADVAGHPAIAAMMSYVDHSPEPALERLDAERRAEARRDAIQN